MLLWKRDVYAGNLFVPKRQRTERWHNHFMRCFSGITSALRLQKDAHKK